jgi:phosphate transport system protein
MSTTEHIVKSFDDELGKLRTFINQMGEFAGYQLQHAVEALGRRDTVRAGQVLNDDAKVDELERQVVHQVVRMLALRQPMAGDLRQIVSALKMSADLERNGDYAANIAKRTIALAQMPAERSTPSIAMMAALVAKSMKDAMDAYADEDAEKAISVWQRDEETDRLYTGLFRELLTYMMEDQRNISPCIHLLFIAKNLERMGDHATNIAETVHFMVRGTDIEADRPKGDTTSFAVLFDDETGSARA